MPLKVLSKAQHPAQKQLVILEYSPEEDKDKEEEDERERESALKITLNALETNTRGSKFLSIIDRLINGFSFHGRETLPPVVSVVRHGQRRTNHRERCGCFFLEVFTQSASVGESLGVRGFEPTRVSR